MSNDWRYMPILKWKQGEQHALRHLTQEQWAGITPLLELQPIISAPDIASIKSALPPYLNKVSEQIIKSIPEGRTIFIDTGYISPGLREQLPLLFIVCLYLDKKLSHRVLPAIPTTHLELLDALSTAHKSYLENIDSVLLRTRIDQMELSQVIPSITTLSKLGVKKRSIHLLIDQFSIVDNNPHDCFATVEPYLEQGLMAGCASMTVGGGSFPINLMGFKQGVTDVPRIERKVFDLLLKTEKYPALRYSDYTVTNPAPLPDIDSSKLNPSVAIRYATGSVWSVYKAKGFKKGPPNQYRNLCKLLVSDVIYSGEEFSYGDRQYKSAADDRTGNGNPSSWRKEATSHHIVFTINSL